MCFYAFLAQIETRKYQTGPEKWAVYSNSDKAFLFFWFKEQQRRNSSVSSNK